MRIKIGPYIHHWSTQQTFDSWLKWHHGKWSWEVEDSEQTRLDHVVEWVLDHWQTVLNFTINQVQERRSRTQKIHIDKYDTWSMDTTLSPVILPLLVQLSKTKNGAPLVEDIDVPEELKSTTAPTFDGENGEVDDNHFKRWDYVLGEMIWAFDTISDSNWADQFHTGRMDILWTPLKEEEETFYRMDKGPKDTHVFDAEGYKKFDLRISNGTRLFGKYYRALWD